MHAVILIIISRMRKKKQYHTLSLLWITAVGDFQPLPLMQKLLILPSCSYYSFFLQYVNIVYQNGGYFGK
jgi:hypothetical protein